MKFVCFLLPAFISVYYLKKNGKDIGELVIDYGIYCTIINLLVLLLLMIAGRMDESLDDSVSIRFYFLYLIASMFLAYCLPRISNYCKNNFSFNVKRVKNEKR